MLTPLYAQTLRDTSLLRGLQESLLQHLEEHLTPWPSHASRFLFFKGDPEYFVAFVHRGAVYHALHEPGGRELILGDTPAGGLVGESALLQTERRSFTAQLSPDCEVTLLHRRHFALLQANPDFMVRVQKQVCSNLQQMSDFVESVCLHGLEARLARHLLNRMKSRDEPEVTLPANQSIFAAMLNVSRPRLSTLLQRWQREGLIRPHARELRIENPERLRHIGHVGHIE
jgi:CRP/FNR family transcriptional regulator, cyclic AMP receptor protein